MKAGPFVGFAAAAVLSIPSQASSSCLSGPVNVYDGYMTGTICQALNDYQLRSYVIGYANGILVSTLYGAHPACVARFARCTDGKTDIQLAAVLRKYLNDHPEEWDMQCTVLTYRALLKICPIG